MIGITLQKKIDRTYNMITIYVVVKYIIFIDRVSGRDGGWMSSSVYFH